ncbi:Uncharacterised protein [Mycobacteroides abscessus subsp. abscessus]|nr:Uncharacterised protein [Mycobacteroides abscessus subsp. abscessus]
MASRRRALRRSRHSSGATKAARISRVAARAATAIPTSTPRPMDSPETSSRIGPSWKPIARNTAPSPIRLMLSQFCRSESRWRGLSWRGARTPVTRPATTAATSPEAPAASVGIEARNGTVKDRIVLTVGSSTRRRTARLATPTTEPTTAARVTEYAREPTTPQKENPAALATIAVRSITRAVASLSRPSPSSSTTTRRGTGPPLMIEVATASVGLTIAPRATPHAKPRSGISHWNSSPSSREVMITRSTDSPEIAPKSRRKLMVGMDTAAAYSSSGRMPCRMISGSTSTPWVAGIRLSPTPTSTSSSGAASPSRGPSTSAAAMMTNSSTPVISSSSMGLLREGMWLREHATHRRAAVGNGSAHRVRARDPGVTSGRGPAVPGAPS